MKLRNGMEEDDTAVAAVMVNLRRLGDDFGENGLIAALKVANGGGPRGRLLEQYGLAQGGHMPQTVKNVILSAVTGKGRLFSPGKENK